SVTEHPAAPEPNSTSQDHALLKDPPTRDRLLSDDAETVREYSPPSGPQPHREDIPMPDMHLLRRIGAGSYGEVWLAQAITGALRAVKIVWREDFEFEKTFRREFEGIQQFEPISRGHQGLVDVLHVGWNEQRGFYYYVMELGDDAVHGADIDVETYVPRTLSTDFKRHGRLNLEFCRETGVFLADALGYLHSYGLTHRDIKPSNIIFVGGVCKLADIGLVAAHGERSFVGTEGFVPPEGPGTFAADIFSLGKVLYEISSGKDRMDFPEVPDDLQLAEMNFWRDWNQVICRACAPDVFERYASAAEFAAALREVGVVRPEPLGRRLRRGVIRTAVGAVLAGSALSMVKNQIDWRIAMPALDASKLTPEELAHMRLPREGRLWMNNAGLRFAWKEGRHIADRPVTLDVFNQFLDATMRPFEGEIVSWLPKGGKPEYIVVVPPDDADTFCEWLQKEDRSTGSLNDDYEYRWRPDAVVRPAAGSKEQWSSLRLELSRLHFGEVAVFSTPPGAEVQANGEPSGVTPFNSSRVRVGEMTYELHLPGYKRVVLSGKVEEGKRLKLEVTLKPTRAVVFHKKWNNSFGMEFVPLGEVLISSTEVRRADFAEFFRKTVSSVPPPVSLDTDRLLPMTHVSRAVAQSFCRWLTMIEKSKGLLESNQLYRLPTDDEWSMAAGLPREKGDSPAERSGRIEGIYPWGFIWPPLPASVNLRDGTDGKNQDGIKGFTDGFPGLAPVRSFRPDPRISTYDLSGNVWEWVQEDYGGNDPKLAHMGVVRGGSWRTKERTELLASYRRAVDAGTRADDIGIRIVLSTEKVHAREDE
ncbi:MAG: SUMF1/EgtB/PvdO family nonheme iron enzyme, partial [Verrucomicrobiaceae bacterium]